MSQNNIIYDINGKISEASGSYYDDDTNSLVIKNLTFNSMSVNLQDGVLFSNNSLSSSNFVDGKYLAWDTATSTWLFKTGSVTNVQNSNFAAGSDLSGTFGDATVRNLSNVTTGALSVKYGGTGLSSSQYPSGESLLVYSGGDSYTLLTASGRQDRSIVTATANGWDILYDENISPYADLIEVMVYTNSAGSPYIWNKPEGTKAIRVLVQGAGGGGASGGNAPINTTSIGGAGGGASGGFIDYFMVIQPDYITNATVSVGAGGSGGVVPSSGNGGAAGSTGGNSFFRFSSGMVLAATGGVGGQPGSYGASTAGVGGEGGSRSAIGLLTGYAAGMLNPISSLGDVGSSGGTAPSTPGGSQSEITNAIHYISFGGAGGAPGGGSGATINGGSGSHVDNAGKSNSRNGGNAYTLSVTGSLGITFANFSPSSQAFDIRKAGGGGGGANHPSSLGGLGGSGSWGSGGGGAGASVGATGGSIQGGRGGDGYVAIISYKF